MSEFTGRVGIWEEVGQDSLVVAESEIMRVSRVAHDASFGHLRIFYLRAVTGSRTVTLWKRPSAPVLIMDELRDADGLCHKTQISGDCSLPRNHNGFCDWEA